MFETESDILDNSIRLRDGSLCHATKANAKSGGEGLQLSHYASNVQETPPKLE
jgi:hypothetical protein